MSEPVSQGTYLLTHYNNCLLTTGKKREGGSRDAGGGGKPDLPWVYSPEIDVFSPEAKCIAGEISCPG